MKYGNTDLIRLPVPDIKGRLFEVFCGLLGQGILDKRQSRDHSLAKPAIKIPSQPTIRAAAYATQQHAHQSMTNNDVFK